MVAENDNDPSPTIINKYNKNVYQRGKSLGNGTFGECFEVSCEAHETLNAVRIISKQPPSYSFDWDHDTMKEAASIHQALDHKYIIKFYEFFDDDNFWYIVTELCGVVSLLNLLRIRRTLTQPEVRYFSKQILFALQYLHQGNIIHRNLNLENVLITNNMIIKIGGFEYCTKMNNSNDKKDMICGSPNFRAPEMIEKMGYGLEVDIWAFGCIMFTILVGKMPFSSQDVEDTHTLIRLGKFSIPTHINLSASKMIRHILVIDPKCRPNVKNLLRNPYYFTGYTPFKLPQTALTITSHSKHSFDPTYQVPFPLPFVRMYLSTTRQCNQPLDKISELQLNHLKTLLLTVLSTDLTDRPNSDGINKVSIDPSFRWICSWVDLSNEYGLGYRFSDRKVGVLFVDGTKIILFNDTSVLYVNDDNMEVNCNLCSYPHELVRKLKICGIFERSLVYPINSMASASCNKENCNEYFRPGYITNWIRYKNKIVLLYSSGMLQINYEMDDSNVIVCPKSNTITFIEYDGKIQSFNLNLIEKNGCTKILERRIWFAWKEVFKMIENKARLFVKNIV